MMSIQMASNIDDPFPSSTRKVQALPQSYGVEPPLHLFSCCPNLEAKTAVVSSVPFNSLPPLAIA